MAASTPARAQAMEEGAMSVTRWIAWLLPLIVALLLPGAGAIVALLLVLLTLVAIRDARAPTLALLARSWQFSVLAGIAAGTLIHFAFELSIDPAIERATGSAIDLSAYAQVEDNLAAFAALLALGLAFGGVAEELVYRGFIIGWGTRLFGNRTGPLLALVSAAAFGAAHLYQGMAGVLSTGLIGASLGALYLALDKKLLPAIVAHMTINAFGITSLYLGM